MNKKIIFKWLVVLAIFFPCVIFAQSVSGIITDQASSLPIPGASVLVKGTATGVSTDFNGNYSIKVNSFPTVLVFSYLGYESKEVSVDAASSSLNVTMIQSATNKCRWSTLWEDTRC
jgi:hypothetical protein